MFIMRTILQNLWLALFFLPLSLSAGELPEIYETVPSRLFQTLGPVGAGAKEVGEARQKLRQEAAKMDADAVVAVVCESGGIKRNGLMWAKETAYCKGMAVKYESSGLPQK